LNPESHDPAPSRSFRICAECGRPTPSHSPDCVNCGARSLQSVVIDEEARAEQRFARAFFSRSSPLTYAILGFNLLVYLLMALAAGGNLGETLVGGADRATLIAFGAKTNELLHEGEWFRLVTPIFIHIGLIHLASNSYALWIIGPQVERLYGSVRFLLIYLISGVGGVLGSYLGHALRGDPTIPSAGASGALFGLFGVLAVFGYKYRHELPPAFRRSFGAGVLPVIAINLFIGFTVPFIDNWAHIGGLITGGLLAFVIPYVAPGKERVSPLGLVLAAACLLVIGYSFTRAYLQSGPHLARRAGNLEGYLDGVNSGRQAMAEALGAGGDAERQKAAKRLGDAVGKLEAARAPDARAETIRRDLTAVLRKQQEIFRGPSPGDADQQANAEAYDDVNRQIREWVAAEGVRLGLRQGSDKK